MNNNNIWAKGRNRRGRPEEPLEVQIEFINDGKTSEIWNKIFELLETGQGSGPLTTDSADPNQLSLF
jgi:hypothetical protein